LEERFTWLDWTEDTAPLLAALDVLFASESFGGDSLDGNRLRDWRPEPKGANEPAANRRLRENRSNERPGSARRSNRRGLSDEITCGKLS